MAQSAPLRYLDARPPDGARVAGTLVLLHAFPLNARMWTPQFSLANDGWRVIAPQLKGMDGGGDETPAASFDDVAGSLVDLLDALHIESAVIGGVSMGGYMAFALYKWAARYFAGMLLADTQTGRRFTAGRRRSPEDAEPAARQGPRRGSGGDDPAPSG